MAGRIGFVAIKRFIVEILACIEDINQGWQMDGKDLYARMYVGFHRVTRATWITTIQWKFIVIQRDYAFTYFIRMRILF